MSVQLSHLYRFVRRIYADLSIDVAAGAVCCQLMVARLEQLSLPFHLSALLFFTVLLIYWLDHWQDAGKIKDIATSRHYFFFSHRKKMTFFIIILFLCLLVATFFFLSAKELFFGITLACISGVYLLLVKISGQKKWIFFQKEIWIALIFTAGIWGSVWQIMQHIPVRHVLLSIIFALIAFQNLLLFGYFEAEEDSRQEQRSMVRLLGKESAKKIFYTISLLALFFCIVAWGYAESKLSERVVIAEMSMSGILAGLFYYSSWSFQYQRYRYIGDAVFLIPVIFLLAG